MPEAISDSSTLIHLAGIRRLELLKEFHEAIVITPAVWEEVVVEGRTRPGASEVNEANNMGWIKVIAPTNESVVRLLERELHKGEAETMHPCHSRPMSMRLAKDTPIPEVIT